MVSPALKVMRMSMNAESVALLPLYSYSSLIEKTPCSSTDIPKKLSFREMTWAKAE